MSKVIRKGNKMRKESSRNRKKLSMKKRDAGRTKRGKINTQKKEKVGKSEGRKRRERSDR